MTRAEVPPNQTLAEHLRQEHLKPHTKQFYIRLIKGGRHFSPDEALLGEDTRVLEGNPPFGELQDEWNQTRKKVRLTRESWGAIAAKETNDLIQCCEASSAPLLRVAFAGWGIPQGALEQEVAHAFAGEFFNKYCGADTEKGMQRMANQLIAEFGERHKMGNTNYGRAQMEREVLLVLDAMDGWLGKFFGKDNLVHKAFIECTKAQLARYGKRLDTVKDEVLHATLTPEQRTILAKFAPTHLAPEELIETEGGNPPGPDDAPAVGGVVVGDLGPEPAPVSATAALEDGGSESAPTADPEVVRLVTSDEEEGLDEEPEATDLAEEATSPTPSVRRRRSSEWLLDQADTNGGQGEEADADEEPVSAHGRLSLKDLFEVSAHNRATLESDTTSLSQEEKIALQHQKLEDFFAIRYHILAMVQELGRNSTATLDFGDLPNKLGVNIAVLGAKISDLVNSTDISGGIDTIILESKYLRDFFDTELHEFLPILAMEDIHDTVARILSSLRVNNQEAILPSPRGIERMNERQLQALVGGILSALQVPEATRYIDEWVEAMKDLPLYGDQLYYFIVNNPALGRLYEQARETSLEDELRALERRSPAAEWDEPLAFADDLDGEEDEDNFLPPLPEEVPDDEPNLYAFLLDEDLRATS